MDPRFFSTQAEFRSWLGKQGAKRDELLVGFNKVDSGKGGMTYAQALDEALCFGWIDGVRRNINAHSYSIRFTPRRTKSIWSEVNIKKADQLIKGGQMTEAGLRAFEARIESKARQYSYENTRSLDGPYEEAFKANDAAWSFFNALPASYKRTASWWVLSAKKEETRQKRLATLIAESEAARRL